MTTSTNDTDSIADTGDDAGFSTGQLAQMFNTGMNGDTKVADPVDPTEENDAKPDASAGGGEPEKAPEGGQAAGADEAGKSTAEPEPDKQPDPANTVILAKDGKHTIDFSHLEKARQQRDSFKAEAEEAKRQLAEMQEQAQARADAGQAPTKQDQLVHQAQAAIDAGVDPSVFGDFDEEGLTKGIVEVTRRNSEKLRAELKVEVMQELRAEIAPLLQQQQQDALSSHVSAILQAHPAAPSILESTEFAEWKASHPSYVQTAMAEVLDKGSSKQVVELLDSYKAADTQKSPEVAQPKATQAAAQKVVEQLKQPVPNSPTDIPGGRTGGGTLAERLGAMNEVDLFNAVNNGDISESQLNAYLSRKS